MTTAINMTMNTRSLPIATQGQPKTCAQFDRDRSIAWYYLGGFGICHTQASQARILMWDSAA
ncbi:MAG: hypothetical protein HQL77_13890 [Magnetococcales bacterium]|nr:hypothetical protein [Magnetococcales bacterium]